MRVILKIVLLLVVSVGAGYGFSAYQYWTNLPQLTQNFCAEINAPILKFPPEQCAWPLYREAAIEVGTDVAEIWILESGNVLKAIDIPAVAEFVVSREAALAKARKA